MDNLFKSTVHSVAQTGVAKQTPNLARKKRLWPADIGQPPIRRCPLRLAEYLSLDLLPLYGRGLMGPDGVGNLRYRVCGGRSPVCSKASLSAGRPIWPITLSQPG